MLDKWHCGRTNNFLSRLLWSMDESHTSFMVKFLDRVLILRIGWVWIIGLRMQMLPQSFCITGQLFAQIWGAEVNMTARAVDIHPCLRSILQCQLTYMDIKNHRYLVFIVYVLINIRCDLIYIHFYSTRLVIPIATGFIIHKFWTLI